jgi:hypothetical protein
VRARVCVEIVALGSAIAVVIALFFASVGAAAGVAEDDTAAVQLLTAEVHPSSTPQEVFEGIVTCSQCGAKHSPALQRPATVCVKVCVHGGAAFALVNADTTYLLEGDSVALKRFAGVRARVIGHRNGKTIKVKSVSAET